MAGVAWRARTLTRSGALAALGVGMLTFGAGGWPFTWILLAFFVPSVALSRIGRARKRALKDIGKGGARDAWQVLANGGIATLCAVVAAARTPPTPRGRRDGSHSSGTWVAGFAGAYAAATADTWGTEIGTLVRGKPRSILTLRPIATGLSGGVTAAGTAAECAGAVWIGAVFAALIGADRVPHHKIGGDRRSVQPNVKIFWAVSLGGICGASLDSLLGTTMQELRLCQTCDHHCETNPHHCGTPTVLVRGVRGLTNDVVNFAATAGGAAITWAIARGVQRSE